MRNMLRNGALALALMGSTAFLANPSFALEPDPDPPDGPEPDFQLDWARPNRQRSRRAGHSCGRGLTKRDRPTATVMPTRLENEDVTEYKDLKEMTDAELEAIIWKAHVASGEQLTDEDIAPAERRLDDPNRWQRRNRSSHG